MVCASGALRRGGVLRFDLDDEAIVVFRGRDTGVVHALPAHCAHQGVDLAHGTVAGDRLRCPLHHWEYSNRCERVPGTFAPPRTTPRYFAAERFGMIFVFLGAQPSHAIPGFSADDDTLHFRAGSPVEIDCPWYVPIANAFDMTHLETVHRRQLTSEPRIDVPDRMTFRVRYSTSVTGRGWSDRMMRALSGNDIRVDITCSGGTLLAVEAHVRKRRSFLLVSLRPTKSGGVSFLPLFGVPRRASGSHFVHAPIAGALFTAFLRRDVRALSGIRFPEGFLDNKDETINACYRYLCDLPAYEAEVMG